MSGDIRDVVRSAVHDLINEVSTGKNIKKSFDLHRGKIHFIPTNYRVLGGLLQALNIKFGNFIERLIDTVVEVDSQVKRHSISGSRKTLRFTAETDALIDRYITRRQLPDSPENCEQEFTALLDKILEIERGTSQEPEAIKKDIDTLFTTHEGNFVYVELKYNDDHDTGKFIDINRKFLKTYAGLVNDLNIKTRSELTPLIYYFNPTKRWGPIYTPSSHIMRGAQLFDTFFEAKYTDVDKYLREIETDGEILRLFDALYERVRNYKY